MRPWRVVDFVKSRRALEVSAVVDIVGCIIARSTNEAVRVISRGYTLGCLVSDIGKDSNLLEALVVEWAAIIGYWLANISFCIETTLS